MFPCILTVKLEFILTTFMEFMIFTVFRQTFITNNTCICFQNQFSSSPIKNVRDLHTPLYKRTPGENFLDNLDFSPIVHGHLCKFCIII